MMPARLCRLEAGDPSAYRKMNRPPGSNDSRFESCEHDVTWTGRLSAFSTNTWFC